MSREFERFRSSPGLRNLFEQCVDTIEWQIASSAETNWADSPIERLFVTALIVTCRVGTAKLNGVFIGDGLERTIESVRANPRYKDFILLRRQVQLPSWRVDFIAEAFSLEVGKWRELIVECDGHDFHERTPDQAMRDRSRDRWAQINGREIFRFTGTELTRDPMGCAMQVIDWARPEPKS